MKRRCIGTVTAVIAAAVMLFSTTARADDGIYTVKKGDTLSKIAKEVYGDKNEWRNIYEANKDIIKNANILYAGQQLILPDASAVGIPAVSQEPATPEDISVYTEDPIIPAPEDVSSEDIPVYTEDPVIPTLEDVSSEDIPVYMEDPFIPTLEDVALENVKYKLNTLIQLDYETDEMSSADVSYSKKVPDGYYYDILNEYSVPGYTWKSVEISYEQAINGNLLRLWDVIGIDAEFRQLEEFEPYFGFTLQHNGVDYADCKFIIIRDDYDTFGAQNSREWMCLLLPEGYDNPVYLEITGIDENWDGTGNIIIPF